MNKFESLKFQEDLVIGGPSHFCESYPLGAIQGPKSEYLGENPLKLLAWGGEKKPF